MKQIEVLPLIFVNALDVHVEDARRIDNDAGYPLDVVRRALNGLVLDPSRAIPAAGVAIWFDVPAELHIESKVRPRDFPWISETQPWVGDFDLPSIVNFLIEDPEL